MNFEYSFTDNTLNDAITKFLKLHCRYTNNVTLQKSHQRTLVSRLSPYLSSSDITWNWALDMFHSCSSDQEKMAFVYLYITLIHNDCIANDCYYAILHDLVLGNIRNNFYTLLSKLLKPTNLLIKKFNAGYRYFFTDIDNTDMYYLMKHFLSNCSTLHLRSMEFFNYFKSSLPDSKIKCLNDFSFQTYEKQRNYFTKNYSQNITNIEMTLKSFYIFIYNSGNDIFQSSDIDINYFLNMNFNFWYKNNFVLLHCNPYDPVPTSDKWVIAPGNLVAESTKLRRSKYITVDFSDILNVHMRFIVKDWYWHISTNLVSRCEYLYNIKEFINYINKLRNKSKEEHPSSLFSPEEIFLYSRYIILKKQNAKLNTIKGFLKYISNAQLAFIDDACFLYLRNRQQKEVNSATDIPDNDLVALENALKKNQSISLRHQLHYIVFHIALATELRISSILNLKKDCLIYDESGKVYLNTNTKTSKGTEIKIILPTRIHRLLETANIITQPLRAISTNKDISDYMFISTTDGYNVRHMITRTFSEYLKSVCHSINIPEYTAANLRDTYMTRVVAMSINSGKSLLEIKSLTLHQVMSTTSKHYVSEKIRDYLENTYMIKIGDVDINGTITKDRNQYTTDENLVQNSCGYCSKETCNIYNGLDCLTCDGFITIVNRIPYFEAAIMEIDKQIKQCNLKHDKEHLLVIKNLNIAFLEKLYLLKAEVNE